MNLVKNALDQMKISVPAVLMPNTYLIIYATIACLILKTLFSKMTIAMKNVAKDIKSQIKMNGVR